MSQPARARSTVPVAVAAVLAVVVALLVVLLLHVDSARADRNLGDAYGPTAAQQAAVQAGAVEAANVLTFSRAHFAADYQRALAGMTGALKQDFSKPTTRTSTLQTMQKNKIDLRGSVLHSAFETQNGASVLVLITVNGSQVSDTGQTSVGTPQRLELTMVQQGGRWLASNLVYVGVQ